MNEMTPPTPLTGKWALVTGATSGIGLATATALAAYGCHLVIVGRRVERLREIASGLGQEFGVTVEAVALDVSDRAACAAAFESHRPRWSQLSILVNNAGLARGTGPLHKELIEDFETMIDVNIKGLLYLTHPIVSEMARRRDGHVINLGSVAGRWVYPGGAVYCATKFSVRALTEGLRLDLQGTGVRVTNIEPGMVETEFSEVRLGDAAAAAKVYEGMVPLGPDDVADAIVWAATRPAHVNVQEIVIYPVDQAGVGFVSRTPVG